MKTRTLIAGAAFLVAGTGSVGTALAQQTLRGSDTLFDVTTDVINACGLSAAITYTGGGSGTGQGAMASGTQHVAPMSRQLNNAQCTAASRQLLIGLDGIVILSKNATHTDPVSCADDITSGVVLTGVPSQFIPCTSDTQCASFGTTCDTGSGVTTGRQFCVPGGTLPACTAAQGCSPDGTYTFDNNTPANPADDWKDVLAQIYGGQNHTGAAQLIAGAATDPNCINADGTAICGARNALRNPARIDCANPVRGVLLASYGQIIRNPSCSSPNPAPRACATTADCPVGQSCVGGLCATITNNVECIKVKHAFRRDDLSGTTDTFQALVGLVTIAPFSTTLSTVATLPAGRRPEIADIAAVANPFCNAGTAAMNKGFSDNLDLDPYRRAANAGPAPDRLGLETVTEAFAAPNNSDVTCYAAGVTPATYIQRERSAPQGRHEFAGGSVDTITALQTDMRAQRCLGVVLPISIPQDIAGASVWAQFRYPNLGQPLTTLAAGCDPGVRVFVNPAPTASMICPDGSLKAPAGTCRLPRNAAAGRFDCRVDAPLPAGSGISDARVFNLETVNNAGSKLTLIDAYQNPNFTTTNLRRFSTAFYRIHMARPDNSLKLATITTACTENDDTQQIGCLVKASPCSFGYAGREAADAVAPFNNLALWVGGVPATRANIENLATGNTPVYPLARKLWFNSFEDPIIGFTSPNLTADELTLSNCMGLGGSFSIVDTAIGNHNFVQVPVGVPRLVTNASGGGCPLP